MDVESIIRLGAFVSTGALLGALEAMRPRRHPEPGRAGRWVGNLGVVVLMFGLPESPQAARKTVSKKAVKNRFMIHSSLSAGKAWWCGKNNL